MSMWLESFLLWVLKLGTFQSQSPLNFLSSSFMKEHKKNSPNVLYLSLASPCICQLSKLRMKFLQSLSGWTLTCDFLSPILGPSPFFSALSFLGDWNWTYCLRWWHYCYVPTHPFCNLMLVFASWFLMTTFAFGARTFLNEPSARLLGSLVNCAT